MIRTVPVSGYDHGVKRQYRRIIWKFFAENCPVPRAYAQCLLLPGPSDAEIEVALSKGFREQNLHIVDRNPAIIAWRARRFPRAQTYGVSVLRAIQERIPEGTLHCINLDLCTPITEEWASTVSLAAMRLATDGLIAATHLFGRNELEPEDRELAVQLLAGVHVAEGHDAGIGRYQSSSPMAFVVGRSMLAQNSPHRDHAMRNVLEVFHRLQHAEEITGHKLRGWSKGGK